MQDYFTHAKHVGDLTRIFVAALEDSRRRKPKLAALWQSLRPRELEGFRLDGELKTGLFIGNDVQVAHNGEIIPGDFIPERHR